MADSIQDVLGAAGECPQVRHGDRVYKLGFPTQRAKARIEELVAAQAVREVLDLKPALPPAAYAELTDGVRADVAAKAHRTGGPLWARVLNGPGGQNIFLLAFFRENHPDVTADEVDALAAHHPEEVNAALLRVLPDFFEIVGAALKATPEQVAALKAQYAARTASA